MYSFNIDNNLSKKVKKLIRALKQLNVPLSKNILFVECKGLSKAGWCKKSNKNYDFVIAINKLIVFEKDFIETLAHELLHTIPNCFNHNKIWKKWADLCLKKLGIEIQISGKVYLSSNQSSLIPINQQLSNDKQFSTLSNMLKNNIDYLFKNTKEICCHLNQNNRDYLFLYLRKKHPLMFCSLDKSYYTKVIDEYASSKAKHMLALEYLSGSFDYLNLNFKQWVYFSGVWALTKDFIDCENRFINKNS